MPFLKTHILLVMALTLISGRSYAISNELKLFLEINESTPMVCDEEQFKENQKQICVRQLCGSPADHKGGYVTQDILSPENLKLVENFYQEISPEVKNIVAELVKRNEIVIKQLEEMASNKKLYDFTKWVDEDYQNFRKLVPQEDLKCQDKCSDKIQSYIQNIDLKTKLNELKRKNDFNLLVAQRESMAKAELVARALQLKRYENHQLRQNAEKRFLDYIEKEFDRDSSQNFKLFLAEQQVFAFKSSESMSDEDYKESIKSVLKSQLKDVIESSTNLHESNSLWMSYAKINNDLTSDFNLFSQGSLMVTDKFNTVDKKIEISEYSCSSPDHGQGILIHELAHALSYALKNNILSLKNFPKYQSLRDCAKRFYKTEKRGATKVLNFPGDIIYSEEDTADLITYEVTKNSKELFSCAFIKTSFDKTEFVDLNLKNDINYDSHSSSFARVLKEAKYKRKTLPSECQSIIDEYQDNYDFNSCF